MIKSNWLKGVLNSEFKPCFSEPGSPYKDIYSPKIVDGVIELKKTGKTCLYDYIQTFKDSVDINVLVKRFQMGDTAALMRGGSFYADITEMPSSFAEMLQVSLDAEQFFNKLPAEEKQKFDNNFTKFISSFGSDEFLAALGVTRESSVEVAPENKEEVVNE